MGRGLAIAFVGVIAAASSAFSAEVDWAEVEGTSNTVEVPQGGVATFSMQVWATGSIRCTATPTQPALAMLDTSYLVGADGGVSLDAPVDVPFYAGAQFDASNCDVTWDGDPVKQTVAMTVRAHKDAPLGDHVVWLRLSTSTPPGSGDSLRDRRRSFMTFTVVPGSDTVPPVVTCGSPHGTGGDNGWYVSAVEVDCTASDDGSGLADAADAAFTLATSDQGTVSTSTRTVADAADNTTDAGPFGPFNVDLNDPEIHLPLQTASVRTVTLGEEASLSFACSDSVSGVADCSSPDGPTLDTSTVGLKTHHLSATDHAGRSTTLAVTYHVVYDVGALELPGADRSHKAGSAIPVSWTLNGVSVLSSFEATSSSACEEGASGPAGTPGKSGPTYDPGTDRYRLVWKTDKDWSGSCRTLHLHLADGTVHSLDVTLH